MDGVETLCLLEDDVVFHPKAGEMLERLLQELPEDWDQVYLGRQHLKEPEVIPGKSFVWRARNINRTHAFILLRCEIRLWATRAVLCCLGFQARPPSRTHVEISPHSSSHRPALRGHRFHITSGTGFGRGRA